MYYICVRNNVKIAIDDINKNGAKSILFLHGWPINRMMFEYQIEKLLAHDYRCITMDFRGFGDSDVTQNGYSYNQLADDVFQVIQNLQVEDIILAGFSMGGAIALRYMSLFKGYKVSKLALLATAAPIFTKKKDYVHGMTKEDVNQLMAVALNDRPQMVADFVSLIFESKASGHMKEWFVKMGLCSSAIATIKTIKSLRDENLSTDLKHVHVPVGIFHGKQDKICSYELAEVLQQGIRGAKLFPFNNSGHAVFYDELEKFNQAFLSFLER